MLMCINSAQNWKNTPWRKFVPKMTLTKLYKLDHFFFSLEFLDRNGTGEPWYIQKKIFFYMIWLKQFERPN